MKILVTFLSLTALLQFAVAFFGNYKYMREEDNIHREPPIYETISQAADEDIILEGWVPTKLNQFDPMDNRTFLMRYLMNRNHTVDGGPIFIFVGGEWTITPPFLLYGHFYDMAKNLSGLMIYTEHRYYGFTTPTPNLELDNMKYLNTDQALADLAHFIVHIKNDFPQVRNSKVILVGCSYSAIIVTWFMQKYPHLAHGAWSMSAPILAQVDFVEYYEVVSEAIHAIGGSECSDRIKEAFDEMERLYRDKQFEQLGNITGLCEPLDPNNMLDAGLLFTDFASPWSAITQFNSKRGQDIVNACENLAAINTSSPANNYAQWIFDQWDIGENKTQKCYDNRWSTFLEVFGGTEWTDWVAQSAWRQWLYQTCAEIGMYQTSGSENIIFGSMFPVNVSLQFCMDLYENHFPPNVVQRNVDRTNVIYGGMQPNVRNVYTTHGQYDPWRPLGVSTDINDESPTVILPDESHCSDMSSISEWDSPEMIASKERIFALIKSWVGVN